MTPAVKQPCNSVVAIVNYIYLFLNRYINKMTALLELSLKQLKLNLPWLLANQKQAISAAIQGTITTS